MASLVRADLLPQIPDLGTGAAEVHPQRWLAEKYGHRIQPQFGVR